MESGFCSSRTDAFPAGLRVLAVDDDPTCLKILENMLKKCSYEVTAFYLARDALNMLRERKYGFDIVISDVNMPDMDGFKLLEQVRLEMDIPFIMMSVDAETSRVMKGVEHGACDYLVKPVGMNELKNIWQHVFRKKIREGKNIESHECMRDIQVMISRSDKFDEGEVGATRKRNDMENKRPDDQESVDSSTSKKARVVWSVDLHQKFVDVVTQIGFDGADPNKILDLMNVPWLTRENVASHLQKYRFYLSKLRKEVEVKTCEGMKQQDFTHPAGSFGSQTSTLMDPKDATGNCNPKYAGNNTLLIDKGTSICGEADKMAIASIFPVDLKETSANVSYQTILSHPLNYHSSQSNTNRIAQTWNEVLMEQFKQPPIQDPEPYALLGDDFSHALQSAPQHLNLQYSASASASASAVGPETSVPERDKPGSVMITPLCSQSRSNHGQTANPETSDCKSQVGCASTETMGLQDMDLFDSYNSELFAELEETCYYDELGFKWSNACESIQNSFVDQGLFAASGVCYP